MAKFHFFTEVDLIQPQTSSQAYGPVLNAETEKYRVTSLFEVSQDAKAYAVCDGIVFVQPLNGDVNSDYVNLLLKPTVSDLENGFTPVEYFIYRGLKKANFILGQNQLVPLNHSDSTELTNDIWDTANYFHPSDPDCAADENAIGWDKTSMADSTLLTEIFYTDDSDHQLAHVSKGMFIGYFDTSVNPAGFEILLKDRLYLPDLSMMRSAANIISANAPTGTDIPGNEPIANMREREKILNFVDPAAYLMLFYEGGIHCKFSNAPENDVFEFDNIYNIIVSKFQTKNTLYIDIRNENGYSLNYYKDNEGVSGGTDYGKHINYSIDGTNFTPIEYYTYFWPIFSFPPSANNTTDFNILYLKFRNYYNPSPLIYLDYAIDHDNNVFKVIIEEKKFNDEILIIPSPIDWSNQFSLIAPNLSTLSVNTQLSFVIKIINIRKYESANILPSTVIPRAHYLDNCFGPLFELPALPVLFNSQWITGLGKRYINIFGDETVDVMAELSLRMTPDHVIFSLEIMNYKIMYRLDEMLKEEINNTGMGSGRSTNDSFLSPSYTDYFAQYEIEIKQKILVDAAVQKPVIDFVETKKKNKIVISLILTRQEYDDLINTLINSNCNTIYNDAFITIDLFQTLQDDNGIFFKKGMIKISGLDSSGSYILVPPNTGNIIVYTVNGLQLNSEAAGLTLSGIPDKKSPTPNLTPAEMVQFIQRLEEFYASDTTEKFTTRLRVLYYGGTIFNAAIPDLQYAEANGDPVWLNNSVTHLYSNDYYKEAYDRLASKADENDIADNPSPYLFISNNNLLIDIGHFLYGLQALLHPLLASNTLAPISLAFQAYNLDGVDYAGWPGDVGLSVGDNEWQKFTGDPPSNDLWNPVNPDIDRYYEIHAPNADLEGDIDAFGLWKLWDYNVQQIQSFKLSELLSDYYINNSHPYYNFNNRYKIFCEENNIIVFVSGITYSWPDYTNLPVSLTDTVNRIATFWFDTKWGQVSFLTKALFSTLVINSYMDSNYVLIKFLQWLKPKLQSEQGANIILI